MKVLVCGGAGYIGTQFVRVLLQTTQHQVVILDSLIASHGRSDHVETEENFLARKHKAALAKTELPAEEGPKRFATLEVGDVRDTAFLGHVFKKHAPVDVVVHMGAHIIVPESVRDPLRYYDNNVVGMLRLLETMHANHCDKLIFSSTAALFGNPFTRPKLPNDPDPFAPILPNAVMAPESPYGSSKLMCEQLLRDSAVAYGIKSVCLRYFNACGADDHGDIGETHEPESHLIPLILRVPLAEQINAYNATHHPERKAVNDYISIFGTDYPTPDGTCIRDYVHVYDLATAHVKALDYLAALTPADSERFFTALNLGTSTGFSVREVIEAARRVTGHPIPAREEPRREGDPPVLVASGEEAKKVLGWTLRYNKIDDIVATAWNFHKTHPSGYE